VLSTSVIGDWQRSARCCVASFRGSVWGDARGWIDVRQRLYLTNMLMRRVGGGRELRIFSLAHETTRMSKDAVNGVFRNEIMKKSDMPREVPVVEHAVKRVTLD
jgi:hypothetical protein